MNDLLKRSFRPEFLNRLDEIVFYKPLKKEEIFRIVDLLLASLKERLAEKRIGLEVTESAKNYIAEQGYDPVYGARPLKRYLQHSVETMLAKKMIANEFGQGDTAIVDFDGEGLTIYARKAN